jgi:hypothetical protein
MVAEFFDPSHLTLDQKRVVDVFVEVLCRLGARSVSLVQRAAEGFIEDDKCLWVKEDAGRNIPAGDLPANVRSRQGLEQLFGMLKLGSARVEVSAAVDKVCDGVAVLCIRHAAGLVQKTHGSEADSDMGPEGNQESLVSPIESDASDSSADASASASEGPVTPWAEQSPASVISAADLEHMFGPVRASPIPDAAMGDVVEKALRPILERLENLETRYAAASAVPVHRSSPERMEKEGGHLQPRVEGSRPPACHPDLPAAVFLSCPSTKANTSVWKRPGPANRPERENRRRCRQLADPDRFNRFMHLSGAKYMNGATLLLTTFHVSPLEVVSPIERQEEIITVGHRRKRDEPGTVYMRDVPGVVLRGFDAVMVHRVTTWVGQIIAEWAVSEDAPWKLIFATQASLAEVAVRVTEMLPFNRAGALARLELWCAELLTAYIPGYSYGPEDHRKMHPFGATVHAVCGGLTSTAYPIGVQMGGEFILPPRAIELDSVGVRMAIVRQREAAFNAILSESPSPTVERPFRKRPTTFRIPEGWGNACYKGFFGRCAKEPGRCSYPHRCGDSSCNRGCTAANPKCGRARAWAREGLVAFA